MKLEHISKVAVTVAIVLGIGMVVLGSIFMVMGLDARGDIREALVKENVITSKDAPIPGVLVRDADTAKAQAVAIESHTFGRFGPYSSMERDDPNRATYLDGLTLRNSLNMAVLGFKISELVVGIGALIIGLGVAHIALLAPVLYWGRGAERHATV